MFSDGIYHLLIFVYFLKVPVSS